MKPTCAPVDAFSAATHMLASGLGEAALLVTVPVMEPPPDAAAGEADAARQPAHTTTRTGSLNRAATAARILRPRAMMFEPSRTTTVVPAAAARAVLAMNSILIPSPRSARSVA